MHGPFPIDVAVARARTVDGVAIVGNAADLDEATQVPPRNTPALFVLVDEQGDPPLGGTGVLVQNMTPTLKLVMWVRHVGGAEKVVADMVAFERAVRTRFFGWRPSPEHKPLRIRASGNDQGFNGYLIRQLLMTGAYSQTTEATTP